MCGLFGIIGTIGFLGGFVSFFWGAFKDRQEGAVVLFLSALLFTIGSFGLMFWKCQ